MPINILALDYNDFIKEQLGEIIYKFNPELAAKLKIFI